MTETVRQSRRLGIIGSAVGLLALLVSALTYLLPDTLLYKPVYSGDRSGREEGCRAPDLPYQTA